VVPQVVVVVTVAGALGGGSVVQDSAEPAASTESPSAPSVPLSALERPDPVTRSSERAPSVGEPREPAKPRASRTSKVQPRQDRLVERLEVDREDGSWVLPVASYRLTGTFREGSSLWSNTHTGLDFATSQGTTIVAVAGGRVVEAGWAGSYGYRTIIELPDGTEIWYCHQAVIDVDLGESVGKGQRIGEVGSTGNSTGPHVHIEVRPNGGEPIDPMVALRDHGARP
jgi:murein DD-endopeptidase MepM/ murein hydrolase activator NlpD